MELIVYQNQNNKKLKKKKKKKEIENSWKDSNPMRQKSNFETS